MTFKKIRAGWYASEDGRYAAISDGYDHTTLAFQDATGIIGGEWAACFDEQGRLRTDHQAGTNEAWFATKREAIAYVERHARVTA